MDAATADDAEGLYLVVAIPGTTGACWMCAPVTERALECVRTRRTTPWTVLHHSSTGTVQVWRAAEDGAFAESVVLCADLPALPEDVAAA